MKNNCVISRYRTLLENWIASQKEHIASPTDRPELAYYGTGTNVWGIQTHMKGFAAIAVAATDPEIDPQKCGGYTRETLIETALKLFRFTMESHHTGSYHCTEGEAVKWGHHWLCSLAIERMMHGVDALDAYLTDHDRARFRELLIDEANWLTDFRKVQADPIKPNVPESNLWSGAFLHRVTLMYPDCERMEEYRRHGTAMLLNSISVPSDKECAQLYDGKPLSEWHVGANFFESYSLNHHGYLNIGYMVICLSNIAMFHFSCKKAGYKVPEALYHHFADLWKLVRSCLFDDGRLFRIGGDTRVRYCYCQDYLVPVLALAADVLGEDMTAEEEGWLAILETETAYNGDGSFLKERCELFRERSPLYYTRLEGDRACTISMLMLWHRLFPHVTKGSNKPSKNQLWTDEYHGAYYTRTADRMASFTWLAGERPQGNIVPPSDSSMAESKYNLVSVVEGGGVVNECEILSYSGHTFAGGFITGGTFQYATSELLEEGDKKIIPAQNQLVFCALPDGKTVLTLQLCRALRRCWVVNVQPLHLNIPNDLFNGEVRDYTCQDGALVIDGKLAVRSLYNHRDCQDVWVQKGTARTINIKKVGQISNSLVYENRGMLRVDKILIGGTYTPAWYDKDEILFDFGATLACDTTAPVGESYANGHIRGIRVTGADGRIYILAANFGTTPVSCEMFGQPLYLEAEGYTLLCEGKAL